MHIYSLLIMFDHVMGWAIVWGHRWAWAWPRPFSSIIVGLRDLDCNTL